MNSSNPNLRKYSYYFSIGMVLVYVSLGLLLVFYEVPLHITANARIIAGSMFIVYGLMRAYLIYRKRQQEQEENEE